MGLLAGESSEGNLERHATDPLKPHYGHEVDSDQCSRERTVDEGAIYEEVYVVGVVAQDCDAHGDRDAQGADHDQRETDQPYS